MGASPRILIGTLFSGENEFAACVQSIHAQTYKHWNHVVIKNLPNLVAHERLYQAFVDASSEYDLFIKMDADMVFIDENCLTTIVDKFQANANLDHWLTVVDDWFSNSLILGFHVFSNRARWKIPEGERLFVDPMPTIVGELKITHVAPAPLVRHAFDPSGYQAFHFGVHRMLKVVQPNQALNLLSAWGHWKLLNRVRLNFIRTGDYRLSYALQGVEYVLANPQWVREDYGNQALRSHYEQAVDGSASIGKIEVSGIRFMLQNHVRMLRAMGYLRVMKRIPSVIRQLSCRFFSKFYRRVTRPCNKNIFVFWQTPKNTNEGSFDNFGDVIAKDIVTFFTDAKVKWQRPQDAKWYHFPKKIYLTVGSIVKQSNRFCDIWGAGIKERNFHIKGVNSIHAVRGPQTRNELINRGYHVPEIYGDPALLMPLIHPINAKGDDIGIIPHYVDYRQVLSCGTMPSNIKIIDLTNSVNVILNNINSCNKIFSSSLHGLIVSHAYGVPCLQVVFSNRISGDGVKYLDYFESVELGAYKPLNLMHTKDINVMLDEMHEFYGKNKNHSLPKNKIISELQQGLIDSCPFNTRVSLDYSSILRKKSQ